MSANIDQMVRLTFEERRRRVRSFIWSEAMLAFKLSNPEDLSELIDIIEEDLYRSDMILCPPYLEWWPYWHFLTSQGGVVPIHRGRLFYVLNAEEERRKKRESAKAAASNLEAEEVARGSVGLSEH